MNAAPPVASLPALPGRLDDGTVVHGEVTLGDHTIWLHAVSPDHHMETPSRLPTSHGGLSVQIPDVDAHFEKAKAAGSQIIEVADKKPFQDAVKPVWDKYGPKYAEMIKRIQAE